MTTTLTADRSTTASGFGPTRKTKNSAQREADRWNNSGDGSRYLWNDPSTTFYRHEQPTYWETCVAQVTSVEGGFACEYITRREYVIVTQEA